MLTIILRLAGDFLSTILFMIVWFASSNVLIATGVAIAVAIAQILWMRYKIIDISAMTWASLGLVIVLGIATFLTHDEKFVLMKPSIAHFAIGAIMLRHGWMTRYMPPRVLDVAPDVPVIAGYCWAVLMFALGAGVIATAITGDIKLWAIYVSVVAVAAKIVAFLLQFIVTRIIVRRRIGVAVR